MPDPMPAWAIIFACSHGPLTDDRFTPSAPVFSTGARCPSYAVSSGVPGGVNK